MTDVWVNSDKDEMIGTPIVHAGSTAPLDPQNPGASFQPLRIETIAHDGAYAVSFSIDASAATESSGRRIVVDIEVESGAIGIGCLSDNYSSFVATSA